MCTQMFTAALFTITKTWKQLKINRWMDKENVVHITLEYYSAIEKNETMPTAQHEWIFTYHTK